MPGIIVTANVNTGYFTQCNPAVTRILGFSAEEFMAKPFIELIHPDDRQRTVNLIKKRLAGSPVANFENRYICKDSSYRWLAWHATAADEQGIVYAAATDITELKKAEEGLIQGEKKYRVVFDTSPDLLYRISPDGRILECNDIAMKTLGYSKKKIIGMPVFNLYADESKSYAKECVEEWLKTGKLKNKQLKIVTKDGRKIDVEMNVNTIYDEKGNIIYSISSQRDITERKQAEDEVRQIKESYDRLTNNADEAIFLVKIQGKGGNVVYQNPAAKRIFGYTIADWNSDPAFGFKVIHPDYEEKHRQVLKKIVTNKKKIKNTILGWIAKNGREVILEYTIIPIIDENGEVNFFESIGKDITERKKAEDELRLHSTIMTHMDEGIYLIRMDDEIIVYTNPKFEEMFGYNSGEMIGKHVSIVNDPADKNPDQTAKEIMKVIKKTGGWHGDIRNIRKDGTKFWSAANVSIFNHPEYGKVIISIHTDITERKKAEEKIKASLAEKEILLRELHHRVKNNLQIISSLLNMQLMLSRNKASRKTMKDAMSRINTMALIHAHMYESEDLTKINMSEFISKLINKITKSHTSLGCKITPVYNMAAVLFSIDTVIPCALIINELVTNSMKHAFKGRKKGNIEIYIKRSRAGMVRLKVCDNGVGLPEGFDIKNSKTLGLQLVRLLAENQLRGKLEFLKGKGTGVSMEFMKKK